MSYLHDRLIILVGSIIILAIRPLQDGHGLKESQYCPAVAIRHDGPSKVGCMVERRQSLRGFSPIVGRHTKSVSISVWQVWLGTQHTERKQSEHE